MRATLAPAPAPRASSLQESYRQTFRRVDGYGPERAGVQLDAVELAAQRRRGEDPHPLTGLRGLLRVQRQPQHAALAEHRAPGHLQDRLLAGAQGELQRGGVLGVGAVDLERPV